MFHKLTPQKLMDLFDVSERGISIKGISGEHFDFPPFYYLLSTWLGIEKDKPWINETIENGNYKITNALRKRFGLPNDLFIQLGLDFPNELFNFTHPISMVSDWIPVMLAYEEKGVIKPFSLVNKALEQILKNNECVVVHVDGCISPSSVTRTMWFLSQIIPYYGDRKTKVEIYFTDISPVPLEVSKRLVDDEEIGWYPFHSFNLYFETMDLRLERPKKLPHIIISDMISLWLSKEDYEKYKEQISKQVQETCLIFSRHCWYPNGQHIPKLSVEKRARKEGDYKLIPKLIEYLGLSNNILKVMERELPNALRMWYERGHLPENRPTRYEDLTRRIIDTSKQILLYSFTKETGSTLKKPEILIYNLELCYV